VSDGRIIGELGRTFKEAGKPNGFSIIIIESTSGFPAGPYTVAAFAWRD
jgi:hypothetical protein